MLHKFLRPYEAEEPLWPEWAQGLSHQPSSLSVWEEKDVVVVEAAVPGIAPEEVELMFDKGILTIRAQKKEEQCDKERKYFQKLSSSFVYRINVPGDLSSTEPEAKLTHGVLTIQFKKQRPAEPKKIPIRT